MSDYNSSLPVRTEANGDVAVKVVDGATPSQALGVDASGRVTTKIQDSSGNALNSTGNALHVSDAGGSLTVDSTDLDIRDLDSAQDSVEAVQATHDNLNLNANIQVGNTDVANGNPVPVSDAGGSLTVDANNLDIRDLAAATDSVSAWLRDEAGNAFSSANPLPVVVIESEGTEVNDYNTVAALAASGTSNHDYTVGVGVTLQLTQINASGSGRMKIEVQIETGAGTNTFTTRFVQFNSTSTPNMEITLKEHIAVPTGARVRIIRTNRDNQAQDVYSTISGHAV